MVSVWSQMCSRFEGSIQLRPHFVKTVAGKQNVIRVGGKLHKTVPVVLECDPTAFLSCYYCKNHHAVRMFIFQRKIVRPAQPDRLRNRTDFFKTPTDCFGPGRPAVAIVLRSMARSHAKAAICSRRFRQVSCNQAWNPPGAWQVWASPPWRWR